LNRKLPVPVSRLARGQATFSSILDVEDPRIIVHREGLQGYVVVGYQKRFLLGRMLVEPRARLLLLVIAIGVSAGVSLLLARFVVLPVRRLREAGHRVSQGDLSVRVAHTVGGRRDDIALLARDFDAMTERIGQLLTSQQRLMRDVSHELRSPLARLNALLSLARQRFPGEHLDLVERMGLEADRLNLLIEEILEFARLDTQEGIRRRNTDLVDLATTIADDAALEGLESGKDVVVVGASRCLLAVDSGLIQRAIENVVRNALRHTRDHTLVTIQVEDGGDRARVVVDDNGPGVPEAELDHLFEPFYRVEAARTPHTGGSGLGLAIAHCSVRLHGGTIRASNRVPCGLRVTIELPRVSAAA
jgi:two-component system sensor histidine kinase CpxA